MLDLYDSTRAASVFEVSARSDGFEITSTRGRQRLHVLLRRRAADSVDTRVREALYAGSSPAVC